MSRSLLWIVIVIVLIILGVLLFKGRNNTTVNTTQGTTPTTEDSANGTSNSATDNSTDNQASEVTVTYDGKSFSPSTITVKKGAVVTFKNNSSVSMWPASDPHPTHTDLPGFDSKKSVVGGQSYSYTFDKVGTWGYHNHNNSSQRGTVIVE